MINEKIAVEDFENEEMFIIKALHKVIFEDKEVPAKKIANHIGIQYKTLSKMCNPESVLPSVPKFPLVKLPKLAELVDIEPIVDAVCMVGGFVPAKVTDIEAGEDMETVNPINILRKTQQAAKEMAITSEEVIKALEDGQLTEEEYEKLQMQINKLEKTIKALNVYLDIIRF